MARKNPHEPEISRKSIIKGVCILLAIGLLGFIFTNKFIDINPGCTTASILFIVPSSDGKRPRNETDYRDRPGSKRYKVTYEYYVKDKTYRFTSVYEAEELLGIKFKNPNGQNNDHTVSSLSVDGMTALPIKYFNLFPWYHTISYKCND